MSEALRVDVFAEDAAQEALLAALLRRCARDANREVDLHVQWALGGKGRAQTALKQYARAVQGGELPLPDILVLARDANCSSRGKVRREVLNQLEEALRGRAVVACPDPHIERWYLCDPPSFERVVGHRPSVGRRKCQRGVYKAALREAFARAGHAAILGGVEYAEELVEAMDLDRGGRTEPSLRLFLEEVRRKLPAS